MSLIEKMQKAGAIKMAAKLSESSFFNEKDIIPTPIPIINMAFSGDVAGGFTAGLTVLAGESKTFKTCLSLYCLKAYQDKYPDSVCLFYDCEYGVTPQYLKTFGIDASRILHIPVEHIEQFKFDFVSRLKEINRNERVFTLVDSIGNMASKKEVEDAENEKSVADMSRAKAIRSVLRIVTPHLTQKNLPCFLINHVYQEQGMFPKTVIPGGTAMTYAPNQIFVITKAQEKTGTEVTGHRFTLNVHKSRFVKEKSKFPFSVDMAKGINKFSSLLEVSMDLGYVVKPSNGWYSRVDLKTMQPLEEKVRAKDTDKYEFWKDLLADKSFQEKVKEKFQYGGEFEVEEPENFDGIEDDDYEEADSYEEDSE